MEEDESYAKGAEWVYLGTRRKIKWSWI